MGTNPHNLLLIVIGILIGKAYLMEDGVLKKNLSMTNAEVTNKNNHSIAYKNHEHWMSSTAAFPSTSSGLNNASFINNHDIIRSRRHLHHSKNSRKDSQTEMLNDAASSTRKIKDIPLALHRRFNDKSIGHATSIRGNDDSSKLDVGTSSSTVTTSLNVLTSSSIAISSLNSSGDISPGTSSGITYSESKSTTNSDETNNSTSMKTNATDDKSHSQSVELMSYSFTNLEESNDTKILDKLQQRIDNIIATHTNSSNFLNSIAVESQDRSLVERNVQDVTSSMTNVSSISHNGTTNKIPEMQKSYHTKQSSLSLQALNIENPKEMSNEFLKMPMKVIVPFVFNPMDTENNTDSTGVSETNMQNDKKAQDSRKEISQEQPGIIHDYGPQCSTSLNKKKKEVSNNKLHKNITFHERLANELSISVSAEKTKTEACSTNNAAPSRFERSMDAMINASTNIQITVLNNSINTEQGDTNSCPIGSQCDSPSINDSTTQTFQNNNLNVENRSIENELHLIRSTSNNSIPIDNEHISVTIEPISSERITKETNNEKTKSIFLPHINFRDDTESASGASTLNFHFNKSLDNHIKENSTTDENIYIIEGLGYFKDNLDDMRDFEEDLEKRRDPFMNYGDSIDDIILTPQNNVRKISDSLQVESSPTMERHVPTTQLHWEGNFVDRIVGSWWPNIESRAVRTLYDNVDKANLDLNSNPKTQRKNKLELEQLHERLHLNNIDYSSPAKLSGEFYQHILLRALYVTIGVTVFALSVWCKRTLISRKPNVPGLRRFFLKKRRPMQGAV